MYRTPIKIVGGGGHAAVIIDMLNDMYVPVRIFDDNYVKGMNNKVFDDASSEGTFEDSFDQTTSPYCIAVGNNSVREKLTKRVSEMKRRVCKEIIHPNAIISDKSSIQNGSVVMAGAIIQARAKIGYGVIINTGATVDHDCEIGNFAHICPGVNLAGNVKVGERTMIGIGSSVIQGITIGQDITVGAGSVVTKDLLEPGLYVGAPAKLIKKRLFKVC